MLCVRPLGSFVWAPCQPGISREQKPLEATVRHVPAGERNHARQDQVLIIHSFFLFKHAKNPLDGKDSLLIGIIYCPYG